MSTTTLQAPTTVTQADRCDGCGPASAAKHIVVLPATDEFPGGHLLFCGHHAREVAQSPTLPAGATFTPALPDWGT